MTRREFVMGGGAALLGLGLIGATKGCAVHHLDPPTYRFTVDTDVTGAALAAAGKLTHGYATWVQNTHSMEPVLWGYDWIVIDQDGAFDQLKVGQIIVYQAEWLPADSPPVVHRIVEQDRYGFLVEGDNVDADHPENRWRVTKVNYRGLVVGIYTIRR